MGRQQANFNITTTSPKLKDKKELLLQWQRKLNSSETLDQEAIQALNNDINSLNAEIQNIEKLITQAEEAIAQNDYTAAKLVYEDLLKIDPKNGYVLSSFGFIAMQENHLIKAASYYLSIYGIFRKQYAEDINILVDRLGSLIAGLNDSIKLENIHTESAYTQAQKELRGIIEFLDINKKLIPTENHEQYEEWCYKEVHVARKLRELSGRNLQLKKLETIQKEYTSCLMIISQVDETSYPSSFLDRVLLLKAEIKSLYNMYPDNPNKEDLLSKFVYLSKFNHSFLKAKIHFIAFTACGLSVKDYSITRDDQSIVFHAIETALLNIPKLKLEGSAEVNKVCDAISTTLKPLYHGKQKFVLLTSSKLQKDPNFEVKALPLIQEAVTQTLKLGK